ncbi:MAG: hypothetical protein KF764_33940 [Labilithrix sp.]|nr:hypothetical protein [Labilithrix sp.]MBX3220349.1 hypothetical protein [Labilithrix sp.]
MRSLKSGLLGCIVAGLLGTFAVVGCSASGDTGDIGDPTTDTDPTEGTGGTVLPPSNPGDDDDDDSTGGVDKKDAGKDAGKKDAGKDAGPPPPDEGTNCATANQIFKRSCGMCGTQEAVCLANEDGSAGGKVSPYGVCSNQVANGCLPGSTEDIACGNCGTQKRTCNAFCGWSAGQCTGQPTNSCTPGAVEFQSAGCGQDLYRQRSCQATCVWENFPQTCTPPPTHVLVAPTAGGVTSTIAILTDSKTIARVPSGTCPVTGSFSTVTPYAYIEVRNTNPRAATVSIYNSQATGGPIIDTVMVAYTGTQIPGTEAARRACTGTVNDFGNSSLTGDGAFASLDGTRAVTIPANSSVQVYFASYYAAGGSSPATGMVKLNVRTDSVAP